MVGVNVGEGRIGEGSYTYTHAPVPAWKVPVNLAYPGSKFISYYYSYLSTELDKKKNINMNVYLLVNEKIKDIHSFIHSLKEGRKQPLIISDPWEAAASNDFYSLI